jgi:hypothetical protein
VRATTKAKPVKLTPAQAAEVRSLMVDEGYTRAEAVAWVLNMPAEDAAWVAS